MATKPAFLAVIMLFFFIQIFGQTVPPAPTGLRVKATECGKVSLAWDEYPTEVFNAGLEIQRYDGQNGYYRRVKTLQITDNQFDDLGAEFPFTEGQITPID